MAGKPGSRTFLRVLLVIAGFVMIGVLGALIANYVIMPLITGHGATVEIPDVVGLPLEEAIVVLDEQGFQAVANEKRPDTLVEEGRVVEQRPSAGIGAKKGRIVQLVVSSGEESVRVPYLLKLTWEQASSIAERRGFEIEKVDTVQNDTIAAGRIVAMKPDPEVRVKPGTKLHLFISAGPTGKTLMAPNLIDLTLVEVKEMLEADSLILGEVKSIEVEGKGGIVVLQSPDAGVPVGPGDTIHVVIGKEP